MTCPLCAAPVADEAAFWGHYGERHAGEWPDIRLQHGREYDDYGPGLAGGGAS